MFKVDGQAADFYTAEHDTANAIYIIIRITSSKMDVQLS